MALSIAALRADGPVTISDAESIRKSYPAFLKITTDWEVKQMSSTWGEMVRISIFGESHGIAIGVVIDGLPAGEPIDMDAVLAQMKRRAPGRTSPRPRARRAIFQR